MLGTVGGLSAGQKAVNRSHAKIRPLVKQAVATLKSWRLLHKLRCSATRITSLVQAVLTLHLASSGGGGKGSLWRRLPVLPNRRATATVLVG